MTDARQPPPQRGDEHELFERYDQRLLRVTASRVNTSDENVADACAFAWHQLLTHQPHRETVFSWLGTVARREAIRLDGIQRVQLAPGFDRAAESAEDPRDPVAARDELLDLQQQLRPLKQQQKAALVLTALGWTYEDAAKRLGVSEQRVGQILASSREILHDREEARRMHDAMRSGDMPPRLRLLTELQRDPPPFLRAAIGRPPEASVDRGGAQMRKAWASLALAIVDHRVAHGIFDPARAFGADHEHPAPSRDLVERIEKLNTRRGASRSHSRGLGR